MINFLRRIIVINLNRLGMVIFLFIVLFYVLFLQISKHNVLPFYDYPYNYPDYEVVYVCAYDENNNNLKSQLHQEVIAELIKNNIASEVIIDTTYDAVLMRQKNWDFYWFADWCVYVGNQALTNVKSKHTGSGCVSGQINVYFCSEKAY
jgi:hypothetical protein